MDPTSSSQSSYRSTKPLIILDLNKVLVDKSAAYILPKEGATEFLKTLMSKYDVAIWSSMYHKNVINAIKVLKLQKKYRFKFVWSRPKTDPDPDAGKKDIPNYATVKRLSKLRSSTEVVGNRPHRLSTSQGSRGAFKAGNEVTSGSRPNRQKSKIVLIDDNQRKLRFNPANTRLVYGGESYDEILKKIVALLASQK